jgi:imidazolonepropionase-like amidohydrolase
MRPVVTILLAVSTCLRAQVPTPSERLILTNINVIDTRHGATLPNLTVFVKEGVIQAVARIGLIDGARNTRIINGTGKYLIPGLWDMHVHSARGQAWDEKVILPLYLANGITGVRDMGGDPEILGERRKRIDAGELVGPHMVISGPFLNAGPNDNQTLGVNTPDGARQAVRSLKARGVDFITLLPNISPAVYWALADEAKIDHLRIAGAVPMSVSASEAALMGQASIDDMSGVLLASSSKETLLRSEILAAANQRDPARYASLLEQALDTYAPQKAWNLFAEFVDHCLWQVPTLVRALAQANLDQRSRALAEDARIKYVPASIVEEWRAAKLRSSAEQLTDAQRFAAQSVELIGLMRRAGVMMMAGSDAPDTYVVPGFSLHEELELLVKSGLTTTQALQAATFNPALFLTKLDRFGVVETGHVADLVVLEGDPLQDIRNTGKISAVILGGRYFARPELDQMLERAKQTARIE